MKGQVKTWHMVDYCELINEPEAVNNVLTNSIQFSTMDNINATHYIATTRLGYRSTSDADIFLYPTIKGIVNKSAHMKN